MPGSRDSEGAAAPAAPARRNVLLDVFFGRGSQIDRGSLRILQLVALGIVFENYDIGLVNSALPQIADSLAMSTSETGYYLSLVRLGGLAALLLIPFADRVGRRRIFLAALLGMSAGTLLTAFSQTAEQFVFLQVVTRAFMLTGATLAVVILVEEFPAGQRGSAVGLLSILGGLGYGLGAGLYAAVELLPFGWRFLYVLGGLPLLLLPFFRRSLRETRRFEEHARTRKEAPFAGLVRSWSEPVLDLVRTHPRRAAAVAAASFFGSMSSIAFFQYTSFFVVRAHGWAPGEYSLLVLGGGLIGMLGTLVGGRGSDRFGRRRVGFLGLAAAPLFAFLFYAGPSGVGLVPAWGLYVLCMASGDVIIRAFAAELFPTSQRGASGGVLIAVQALGFAAGLAVVGTLAEDLARLGPAVAGVSAVSWLAAVSLLFLPETHRLELEDISVEAPPRP